MQNDRASKLMQWTAAVALGGVSGLLDALAAAWLWQWFVVPLGAQPVSVLHAFGLLMLIDVATLRMRSSDYVPTSVDLGMRLVTPLILLSCGFIIVRWL